MKRSLSTGRTQLYAAAKTCNEHWEQAKTAWQDSVCREFEETGLSPLQAQVSSALHAMDRLSVILAQMQQECE